MSTVPASSEQRVVLRSVSWETYLALTEESESGSGRMTYDQGVLEIMAPGMPHEIAKRLIGRMIETFTLCRGIEIRSSSSTTFKRSELQRGFEADESYYIQHACELRGVREIDLSIHPPPDLVIEVDMTNSSIPHVDLGMVSKMVRNLHRLLFWTQFNVGQRLNSMTSSNASAGGRWINNG